MITYVLSQIRRLLRETPAEPFHIVLSPTCYTVQVNGTLHRVRRDGVCKCGGIPQSPCPALPPVQDYLTAGGPHPLGRHESTWPRSWAAVPPTCPVCDCPTVADHHLDSSHGPGWCCTLDAGHYWQVRLNPLRRALATHRQTPRYPWYDTPEAERQAWLEAHTHLPRCVPNPHPLEVMP